MSSRSLLLVCASLAALVMGWIAVRKGSSSPQLTPSVPVVIDKQPIHFESKTFDPGAPPPDMPPLPVGENAECVSDFGSSASVGGHTRRIDATHATITVTQVKVSLQLNTTIWVPADVTQHVMDHEEGHRQISEHYYETADKVAERIAETYMGKQVDIAGVDLNAEVNKALQQMAAEITDEYAKELNPDPTQLLYDDITSHSRNDVDAKDAVEHAITNIEMQ